MTRLNTIAHTMIFDFIIIDMAKCLCQYLCLRSERERDSVKNDSAMFAQHQENCEAIDIFNKEIHTYMNSPLSLSVLKRSDTVCRWISSLNAASSQSCFVAYEMSIPLLF
jgi:hypothetical protein